MIMMVANQSFQHIWWATLNFTPDLRGAYHYYYYYYELLALCRVGMVFLQLLAYNPSVLAYPVL